MMCTRPVSWLLVLWALLAMACDEEHTRVLSQTSSTLAPLPLEDALLYLTDTAGEERAALVLDVRNRRPRVSQHALPEGAVRMWPRTGKPGEVLLLTEGLAASLHSGRAREATNSYVLRYDRAGEQVRYPLIGRYQQLAVSQDGRFAVAFDPAGSWSSEDTIAVLDLERADPAQPVPALTLRALHGAGPSGVAFSPAGQGRRLAVMLMADAVNLVDLEQTQPSDKVLPLKLPTTMSSARAKKVLFAGNRIFVQPEQSSDVLLVRLDEDASAVGGFRASLSSLATENTIRDIALLESEGALQLVVLGTGTLRLIDVETGIGQTTPIVNGFDQLHVFEGSAPFDRDVRPRALLYAQQGSAVGFTDLARSLRGSERTVEVLTLPQGGRHVLLPSGPKLALVAHAQAGLSLVDLQERTVSSLNTDAPVRAVVLDESVRGARAWVTTESGEIAVIDLTTRTTTPLLLDQPADAVIPLYGDTPGVAVTHTSRTGWLTVLDGAHPTRDSAREVVGFTLTGVLD